MNATDLQRTRAYIDGLPAGLESYPDCLVLADFHFPLAPELQHATETLPKEARDALFAPRAGWMPGVVLFAGQVALLEGGLRGDLQQYMPRAEARAAALFSRPPYRTLIHLLSPNLLLMGAAKRFSSFAKGLELQSLERGSNLHRVSLTGPPHVLTPDVLPFFIAVLSAALKASKAGNVEVTGAVTSPTESVFRGTWR